MRYRYQTKDGKQIWVCEACKKAHMELILLGTWKLIDKKQEEGEVCKVCQGDAAG